MPAPAPARADVRIPSVGVDLPARVPSDYLGLSVEWSMAAPWFGTSRETIVPATVAVLQTLQRDPSTAGVLRVGGNSQDGYVWDPAGSTAENRLFTGVLTPDLVDAVLEVAALSGWRVLLGLNLRADDPAAAAALASYALSADRGGRLLGFELGNEPNAEFGADVAAYVARFTTYTEALSVAGVTVPPVGPALSHEADLSYVEALRDAGPGLITWHHYGNRPTRAALLANAARDEWLARIAAVGRAAGPLPHRMGEGNSVGSGGLDGVSNVLAAATWLTDTLLAGATAGLLGVDVHSWDGQPYPADGRTCWYTPFVIREGRALPRPPFYALALCRYAVGRTARPVTITAAPGELLSAYGFVDEHTGRLYVYVIERSGRGTGAVRITAPPGYTGPAFLSRLGDAGGPAGKTTGINGALLQQDGTLPWKGRPVRPVFRTRFDVPLGPCQAVLLSLGPA